MSVDHSARAKKLTPAELAYELREIALRFPNEGFDYITEAARRLRPAKAAAAVKAPKKAPKAKAKKNPSTEAPAELKIGDKIS